MYTKAIVRHISANYKKCISSNPFHSSINLDRTREQHKSYLQTLKDLNLDVIEVEADYTLPDCCFVEDTAIIHNNKAILSHMRSESRQGEVTGIERVLTQYFSLNRVIDPGFIEGGDVLHFANFLVSGVSQRTNKAGIKQVSDWLGIELKIINDPSIVHLKSYISYVDENTILCTKKYAAEGALEQFEKIIVPELESYAENVLAVNGTILMPKNYKAAEHLLKKRGYDIVTLDTTEFQKCEGALTCLSILF